MAKQKLTVVTEVGTWTRTTARTYTHIVVVNGYKAEVRERQRLENLKSQQEQVVRYSHSVKTGQPYPGWVRAQARQFDLECHAKFLADGSYAQWLADCEKNVVELIATGPITTDGVGNFGLVGWCGRIDLARKLASKEAINYRHVKIFEVATGQEVR